jgi:hypothetical protein
MTANQEAAKLQTLSTTLPWFVSACKIPTSYTDGAAYGPSDTR